MIVKCIECGQTFEKTGRNQKRCPSCQKIRNKELERLSLKRRRAKAKEQKNKTNSKVIDGHVQVCRNMRKCFYGQENNEGCSYALEEGRTRTSQGLYIVNGKCPAYRPKTKADKYRRNSFEKYDFAYRPDAIKIKEV